MLTEFQPNVPHITVWWLYKMFYEGHTPSFQSFNILGSTRVDNKFITSVHQSVDHT